MMMKTIPALILGLACISGCQKQDAPAAAPASAPAAVAAASASAPAAPRATTDAKNIAGSRDGIFTGMRFPMNRTDFITQLNGRLGDNCKRPGRHGRLCPKLEQRSVICSAAVKRPVITDADAARDAGGKYLRCLHRGHA
ncbi:MAG: hypothetical protein JSS25_05895 [Proteobacteria bacterium]|nr:hypothetical protein [Pseudomonadota bacterium]